MNVSISRKASALTYRLVLALMLFIAFALRLWHLGAQSLWHDEAWSIFSAYHPLATGMLGTDPNAPAIFYLSLGAWMQLLGDGIWSLRFWSLLLGVLTVAITALVANRFFGRRTALISAFLVAISPLLWTFSQEIRAYVAMPLYALLLLGLVDHLLRTSNRRGWIWLLLVEILALYTQNLSVPLIAWLNLTVISLWLYQRRWTALRNWLGSQCILGFAYLPWLLSQSPTGTVLNTTPPIAITTAFEIYFSYFTGVKALLTDMISHVGNYWLFCSASMVLGLTVVIGWLIAPREGRRISPKEILALRSQSAFSPETRTSCQPVTRQLLVLSQVFLLPVLSLIELYAAHIDFHPRYFILGTPSLLIFMGFSLAGLSKRGRVFGPVLTGIGLSGATVAAILALGYIATDGRFQHDNFRAIADHYAALNADDAVVIPYNWEPSLDYYGHKLDFKAQIVGIPLDSDWHTIVTRLNAIHAKHIEVLTWYQLPADVRGAYGCLLGAVTEDPPTIFTVNGLSTARYDQPGKISVSLLNSPFVTFGAMNQEQPAFVSNDRRVCVIDDWSAANQPNQSLGVNIQLNNSFGWSLGQVSTDLRTDQQVPTQFWKSGQNGTSFGLIDFPPGLSQGAYPLVVSVYDSATLRKLDMLNKSGAPSGQLASLGSVALTPVNLARPLPKALTISDHWQIAYTGNASIADDGTCSLQPGQQWQISATWETDQPSAQPSMATIRASSDDWPSMQSGDQLVTIPADRHTTLTWAAITIPASAKAPIKLMAVAPDHNSKVIATCTVKASDHLFVAPPIGTLYSADFPGVGTLAGFDWSVSTLSHADFALKLYWKASVTPTTAYTVFVHLLNAAGQVIAQNDSSPANGSRPTTGWVEGEYVADPHVLSFNTAGQTYSGAVTIEVGLYDAITGQRVLVNNGADHVSLPVTASVK